MLLRFLDIATEHPGLAVYATLLVSGAVATFFLTRGHPSKW
jgi:hypothetical protein